MTIQELIARVKGDIATRTARYNELTEQINDIRGADVPDEARESTLRDQRSTTSGELAQLRDKLAMYEREAIEIAEVERTQALPSTPTNAPAGPADERTASGIRVTEKRTYAPEADKRAKGTQFLADVAGAFVGNWGARERLDAHMREERVERGKLLERAVGTAGFSGYVVPQYLVDMNVGAITAKRPFADLCNKHNLPETGMTVYLSRVTTGTSVDNQSAENALVSETDIDDTLISVPVQTAAGSQTISRQSVERGVLTEDVTAADLFKRYATNLDTKLISQATSGLTNVAGTVSYTDASPTGAELYPKLLGALSAAEGVFLNEADVDVIVMHRRRWRWLASQMTSTWPMVGGPKTEAQQSAASTGSRYGSGFAGFLPDGTAVVTDNNIATNLGAGTNEDEIYAVAPSELHLWEDPAAPMFIRAEQPNVKKLGIDLVVYGYYAYLLNRFGTSHQKITGTGLITPTF